MKKYKLLGDWHTHTKYSRNGHGKGTIRENVEAGIARGLKEIHITDHGPGHLIYGIPRKDLPRIRHEVDVLQEKVGDQIKIILGVEANVINYDGRIDIREEEFKFFDKINVGFHSGVAFENLASFGNFWLANPLWETFKKNNKKIIEKNTKALIKVINRYPINMITHPGEKIPLDIFELGKACGKVGTVLEISGSHDYLRVEDLLLAKKTNCEFAIGSDAHRPEDIGRVRKAIDRIEQAGVDVDRIKNLVEIAKE